MSFNNTTNNLFREQKVVNSATNYVALGDDVIINITNTAAPRTVTLPAPSATNIGKTFLVKDASGGAGTNNITVSGASGNIDGQSNYVINKGYGVATFYSNGSNYFIQIDLGRETILSSFKADKGSAQSILNLTDVPIISYDAPDFNIGNDFNSTTGVFTAPRDGSYLFSGQISFADNPLANESFFLYFSVNGTGGFPDGDRGIFNLLTNAAALGRLSVSHTTIENLTAGDEVTMSVFQRTTAPLNTNEDRSINYFMGKELSSIK